MNNEKQEDLGKKPSITEWWKSDPQDFDTAKWFNGSRCYNIGFAPRDNVVVADLDSKPDQGRSVEAFRAERPELTGTPLHRACGGVHLVFRCLDLPQWKHSNGRPYESQVSRVVSAELFHCDHLNVVLPPSVHVLDDRSLVAVAPGDFWIRGPAAIKERGAVAPQVRWRSALARSARNARIYRL